MRELDRRRFIAYCAGSATALGLDAALLGELHQAFAKPRRGDPMPRVIWLAAANCTGCTVSFANLANGSSPTDIGDLLLNTISLGYHPNLMGAAGDLAVESLNSTAADGCVLVVEGGVPRAFGGHTCTLYTEGGVDVTALDAVSRLAEGAIAILAVGTCASFGGVPGAVPNPTDIASVGEVTGRPVINIPGCPTHPEWVVWTIAQLLAGRTIRLDSSGRPRELFSRRIHDTCPFEDGREAHTYGQHLSCLEELGCRGPSAHGDCHIRRWNDGTSWCVEAGAICIGCTESGFPDSMSPFYVRESDDDDSSGGDDDDHDSPGGSDDDEHDSSGGGDGYERDSSRSGGRRASVGG
jgi:hydrogenase small subunit